MDYLECFSVAFVVHCYLDKAISASWNLNTTVETVRHMWYPSATEHRRPDGT